MSDCKFCDKKGLLIFPLRYAVIGGGAVEKTLGNAIAARGLAPRLIPSLPATLGAGVTDLALSESKYAPRMLRNGYLYVLINRAKILYWEGYMIIDDAFLFKFPVELPPPSSHPPFSCEKTSCGLDATVISIENVATVDKISFLYSSYPLTQAKLAEYKANSSGRGGKSPSANGCLQDFDPRKWISGTKAQQHSLKPDQLYNAVPEFMLFREAKAATTSELGQLMCSQLFEPIQSAFAGSAPPGPGLPAQGRLSLLQDKLKKLDAAVFVVHDHIGITQELNAFRNGALGKIEGFLERKDNYKVSNQQKLVAHEKIQELRVTLENNLASNALQKAISADLSRRCQIEPIFPDDGPNMRKHKIGANNAYTHPSRTQWEAAHGTTVAEFDSAYARDLQAMSGQSSLVAKEKWKTDYAPKLNLGEMTDFIASFDNVVTNAIEFAKGREADHLKWVTSAHLVRAFDTYDKNEAASGHAFEGESALCTFGMSGTPTSSKQIEKWISEIKCNSDNIYLRGYYMNQLEVERAANELMPHIHQLSQQARALDDLPGTSGSAFAKKLIDAFKKVDSAYDEFVRSPFEKPTTNWGRTREAAIFAKQSEITRAVFRTGIGKLDIVLGSVVGVMTYSRMGQIATDVGYDEYLLKAKNDVPVKAGPAVEGKPNSSVRMERAARLAAKNAPFLLEKAHLSLIEHARSIVKNKTNLSLKQVMAEHEKMSRQKAEGLKPKGNFNTNNYHQARIGCALAVLESLAIYGKLSNFKESGRAWTELAASGFALLGISSDIVYSSIKSLREVPLSGKLGVDKSADIMRGRFKAFSGVMGTFAGLAQLILDVMNLRNETAGKQRGFLMTIYGSRGLATSAGMYYSGLAAFSYSESFLQYAAKRSGRPVNSLVLKQVTKLAARRVMLLLMVARFNALGLAVTALELAYYGYHHFIDDDALQKWCLQSSFRAQKQKKNIWGQIETSPYYVTQEVEDREYHAALGEFLGG